MELKGRGILDTPLAWGMTVFVEQRRACHRASFAPRLDNPHDGRVPPRKISTCHLDRPLQCASLFSNWLKRPDQ
jgi:hypothetical protein